MTRAEFKPTIYITRGYIAAPYNATIVATARTQWHEGNSHPHFSVTADIGSQAGGCLHDEVARIFPRLKPIIDLHLSDALTGEPMYSAGNGYYYLSGAVDLGEQYHLEGGAEKCMQVLSSHLRIDMPEAEALRDRVVEAYQRAADGVALSTETEMARKYRHKGGQAAGKAVFASYVETLREQWKTEAEMGIALLQSLITRQAEKRALEASKANE